MPFIVATYVYASSQGQRTHSARTNSGTGVAELGWQNLDWHWSPFTRVGNTLFHSTVQLPASSLASVEVTLTFRNSGQLDKQTNKQTIRLWQLYMALVVTFMLNTLYRKQ